MRKWPPPLSGSSFNFIFLNPGGDISVRSEYGRGSVFTLEIPLRTVPTTTTTTAAEAEATSQKQG